MSFHPLLRHRAAPIAALTAGLGMALYPKTTAWAESPAPASEQQRLPSFPHTRKPIYDTHHAELNHPTPAQVHATTIESTPAAPASSQPPVTSFSSSPTPTARLAAEIGKVRLALHSYTVVAEDKTNELLTRALRLENDFTSTVASLAPPKESGEKVVPGSVYVLVAAMAGSIVTRNRNILLRAAVPVAAGVGTSYAVLPITTRNVGDLIWKYEEKYPVIAHNHVMAKERVSRFIATGKAHTQMSYHMAEEKIQGVREAVEEWVKKGR